MWGVMGLKEMIDVWKGFLNGLGKRVEFPKKGKHKDTSYL